MFFKAGVHLKAVFQLGIKLLMQISRLRLCAHFTYPCFEPLCKFFGDF